MVLPTERGAGGSLETRLELISHMLEEAVSMLRTTMTEVRQETEGEPDGDDARDEVSGPGGWPR